MKVYILFLMLNTTAPNATVVVQEFYSKQACDNAATALAFEYPRFWNIKFLCLSKGTGLP